MAGHSVDFSSNGGTTSGYLAIPEKGKGPGVVVIQEWWGLVDHIKNVCDRFAKEGYAALAPDLYHGKTTRSPDEAGKLMMAMSISEAEKDLRGGIQYLIAHQACQGDKVGTIGFCMGGALSLYAATKNPQVGACVVFYGGHPSVKPDLPNLQAPCWASTPNAMVLSLLNQCVNWSGSLKSWASRSKCIPTRTPIMRSSTISVPRFTTQKPHKMPGNGLSSSWPSAFLHPDRSFL